MLDETQLADERELIKRMESELELLTAYQSKIRKQTDSQHQLERKELEEKVSLRRVWLEQMAGL